MSTGSAAELPEPRSGSGAPAVDWNVAASTAKRLLSAGPNIGRLDAMRAVHQLRGLSTKAEAHVREVTGLGEGLPLLEGDVVDRAGWVDSATEGMAALLGKGGGSGRLSGMLAGTAGVQAGIVLAYLGTKVLGQYDPFTGGGFGRLVLVAPNIVAAQRALDVPAEDFSQWVCLHESTHRLQFTAVPWLREHFANEVGRLMNTMDESSGAVLARLPDALREVRKRSEKVNIIELLQSPSQRLLLDRLLALSTLLEGHADHVMDAVGPDVVPSVHTIRSRFNQRRTGGGLGDRLLRALLGVDAKIRQYEEGKAFTDHVVGEVGMAGFNAVWTSPNTLPTRAEIAEPATWIRRIHG
ncbi:coenzyme F420 biosynthesis-associated protein [Pseudonocardiaceae bacterium YIM PH 21723]|nr:coenzyme F420 biosynthesis-associated protein [Pseudonocardiaceae bacterium YIM PH 21723]